MDALRNLIDRLADCDENGNGRAIMVQADAMIADTLDAAWAEAEAALPEGWVLTLNRHKDGSALVITRSTAYRAGKGEIGVQRRLGVIRGPHGGIAYGAGPTPAAALRALAAKLRERAG